MVTTLLEEEIHEASLEVIDRAERMVVTVIEVLSPTNKVAGSRGRASYQAKRVEVMTSPSHFVEIDLLREGKRFGAQAGLPRADYLVPVSRAPQRPRGLIWPILLPQRLPVVSIPLKPEDPDVPLDLQAVFNSVYDRAAYDLSTWTWMCIMKHDPHPTRRYDSCRTPGPAPDDAAG